MIKSEIAVGVTERVGVGRRATGDAPDAMFETVTDALARGKGLRIVGFGTFGTKRRAARTK